MTHKGTVPLKTKRLVLRKFTLDDVKQVFDNWANDSEVSKFSRQQFHASEAETREYVSKLISDYQKLINYYWAITLIDSNIPIGRINITGINELIESACISFMIGQAFWNKGYITEALSSVITFLFEEVGVNRIEGRNDVQNLASEKVMIKCGFQYEGLLRQGGRNSFGLVDCKQYAIIANDYYSL